MAFKKGNKFILELGEERKMFHEFEIAGTDLYVKTDLLEKLTQYAPPEKAKWIKAGTRNFLGIINDRVYKCSNCGNLLDFEGVNCGRGDANYCPNCGAEMEEDI